MDSNLSQVGHRDFKHHVALFAIQALSLLFPWRHDGDHEWRQSCMEQGSDQLMRGHCAQMQLPSWVDVVTATVRIGTDGARNAPERYLQRPIRRDRLLTWGWGVPLATPERTGFVVYYVCQAPFGFLGCLVVFEQREDSSVHAGENHVTSQYGSLMRTPDTAVARM